MLPLKDIEIFYFEAVEDERIKSLNTDEVYTFCKGRLIW